MAAIHIEIKNFRGVSEGAVEGDRLILIGGRNRSGKSSFCQATAAALTRKPIPFLRPGQSKADFSPVLTKASAGMLVRSGAAKGQVTVRNDAGYALVSWPSGQVEATGDGPKASPFAAGIEDDNYLWLWFSLDAKARARHLVDLLGALPSEEDVAKTLEELGMTAAAAAKLAKATADQGWDSVHTAMKEHGIKLKGQWEAATSERYGSDKAIKWLPKGWSEDLRDASQQSLAAAHADAQAAIEQTVAAQAVDESERARLAAIANRTNDIEGPSKRIEELNVLLTKHLAGEYKLEPVDVRGIPCPHCKKPVAVLAGGADGYILKASVQISDAERARREKAIEDHRARTRALTAEMDKAKEALFQAQAHTKESEKARAALTVTSKPGGGADGATIEGAREALRIARDRLDAFEAWTNSRRLATSVERNQRVIDLLAPDGMRREKLTAALDAFNARLRELCVAAKWPTIKVDADMSLTANDRPLVLSSGSERYMAQLAMQVAIGERDGSSMVIFDRADVLDFTGRNGMIALLAKAKMPALIAYTVGKRDMMPQTSADMASYWMQEGKAELVVVEKPQ